MKRITNSIFAILFLSILGCSPKQDADALQSELLQADKDWAAAAKAGDVSKIPTFWADDAINFFPEAPPAVGKKAILELVKRNRGQSGFALSWEPLQAVVAASGEMGYTYGSFRLSFNGPDDNVIAKTGNYVCIWKKEAGESWKCVIESTIFAPA